MGMAGRGMMLHSGGPNSVWHCGGRGVGTAQEKADTAGRDRPSSGCNPLRCCCGGGLASDGVLVPGTRTGGNCVRGQAEVGPSSMDVGLAGGDLHVRDASRNVFKKGMSGRTAAHEEALAWQLSTCY